MSVSRSVFLGWLALVVPQVAAAILAARHFALPGWVIVLAQARAALHLVVLGLLCAVVIGLWTRAAPRVLRTRPTIVAGLVGAMLAALALVPDAGGFIDRQRAAGSWIPWPSILVLAGAAATAAVVGLRGLLARFAWTARLTVLGLAYAVRVFAPLDYANARLFATALLAFAFAATMVGRESPRVLPREGSVGARLGIGALALAGLVALGLPPSAREWNVMNAAGGSLVALHLARLRAQTELPEPARKTAEENVPAEPNGAVAAGEVIGSTEEWFRPRDDAPPIPASAPKLLADDAIVIVITIDAMREELLREDEFSESLPALWKLRADSVWFEQARAPSPSTLVSVLAILTGRYYSQLYFTKKRGGIGDRLLLPHEDTSVRLPERLAAGGVDSTHVMVIEGFAKETGVSRGFGRARFTGTEFDHARRLMDELLAQLEQVGQRPHFFYLHFVDPHAPYTRGGRHGSAFDRYVAEVALVDQEIGRLRGWLAARGLDRRVSLVVSSDHGEAFGEHGSTGHATTVFEELLRVPMLIHVPGVEPRKVEAPVGLIDIAPTVLDLYGLETPGAFMGQSLVPFLRGASPRLTRPIAVDTGRRMQALYCGEGLKAMTDLQRRNDAVYDLNEDPRELSTLAGTDREDADRCLARLRAFFEAHTLRRDGYEPPTRRF